MDIIGSTYLTTVMHAISQAILIPVIIILLIFVVFALISVGGFISEYTSRKKLSLKNIKSIIRKLNNSNSYDEMKDIVNNSDIKEGYKVAIREIIDNHEFGDETRKAIASRILEEEELKMEKIVEKTDAVVRIGPTMGLMGTLIPMGPGLAALGAGDINTLAQAIVIAFDTTVLGLSSSAVCYVISKLRKRWYSEDLSNFEVFINSTLDILEK
ncbi:MotA/TolQ/ExbB proton channel family protein [Methanobrevibacter filiformis]|uniref:MotA/TolQ/ExbB proton channel family protein n=1 Tax=Methanobrevibacter filiformis TaxID=55758 RepID=A0A166AL21_9EURY|nr:MotA/TolQ/ExbB proton channel family protein [Methanobrevibacter filiformis]KZX12174.1 MotA/TolQ/ExbB proton channel family protein [Methanobrevibacter filiformis]